VWWALPLNIIIMGIGSVETIPFHIIFENRFRKIHDDISMFKENNVVY
jgi:hypothetical protein